MPGHLPNHFLRNALLGYASWAHIPEYIQEEFGTERWRELAHARVEELCNAATPGEPIISVAFASRFGHETNRVGGRLIASLLPAITVAGVGLSYYFATPLWNDRHRTAVALKDEIVKTTQPATLRLSPLVYVGHKAMQEWFRHQRLTGPLTLIADGAPSALRGEGEDVSRLGLLAEAGIDIGDLGWDKKMRTAIMRNFAAAWVNTRNISLPAIEVFFAVDKEQAPGVLDEILETLDARARTANTPNRIALAARHVAVMALKNKRPLRKHKEWGERIMDTRAAWLRS